MVDIIQQLCDTKNMRISHLEKAVGFGNGTIGRWDERMPSIDRVQKVADYFNVSLDYLAGRETPEPKLTADETRTHTKTAITPIITGVLNHQVSARCPILHLFTRLIKVIKAKKVKKGRP